MNNNSYKLSIITICYNEPELEKTCESIVNQSWQDFEWIVIDGGSNHETLDIFNKYKHRINHFISEPDNGRYNAMNKGLKLATGEYVNFLNAGDYYENNMVLEKVINYGLDKDIVFGDLNFEDNKNITPWILPNKIDFPFLYVSALPHPSSFIKKTLFDKFGGYNENYKIVSDWEKWLVFILLNHCSYKHIDLICCRFNINGISATHRELIKQERTEVLHKYFSDKELAKAEKITRQQNTLQYSKLEKIFSIKNSSNKKHKIITIFGLQLKLRKKK